MQPQPSSQIQESSPVCCGFQRSPTIMKISVLCYSARPQCDWLYYIHRLRLSIVQNRCRRDALISSSQQYESNEGRATREDQPLDLFCLDSATDTWKKEMPNCIYVGAQMPAASFQHYTVFQKKTPTHIIGYTLRNSCLILIIFDIKITHIIWHRTTA